MIPHSAHLIFWNCAAFGGGIVIMGLALLSLWLLVCLTVGLLKGKS